MWWPRITYTCKQLIWETVLLVGFIRAFVIAVVGTTTSITNVPVGALPPNTTVPLEKMATVF